MRVRASDSSWSGRKRRKSWMCRLFIASVAVLGLAAAGPTAQMARGVQIHVTETAGIRRTTYPVNARLHFDRGVLKDAAHTRLLLNGSEVAAQVASESGY